MNIIYYFQQSLHLNILKIPNVYLLRDDCLVVEQWLEDCVIAEPSSQEVIVDSLCAAAVLRGAHVFAPGVMGLPASKYLGVFIFY